MTTRFYLRIQQFEQNCLFNLSWGENQNQRLPEVQLTLPDTLMQSYETWKEAYLDHYERLPLDPLPKVGESGMRGKVVSQGSAASSTNSHSKLVTAERELIEEFQNWLRRRELHEIRARIVQASSQPSEPDQAAVELLLTCPIELARLPWEIWEIGAESPNSGKIRISRVPLSVRSKAATPRQRPRCRILAIIGSDRRLDLQVDVDIIKKTLGQVAELHLIQQKTNETIEDLKKRIVRSIGDEQGWDALFFAGHSKETDRTGGEIEIVPNASIQISEIKPHLEAAQERGLQLAVFSSCEGLSFAESLIDLGLNQVVVMREKIHNRVAQAFLHHFCNQLAKHQDVQESVTVACQSLKAEIFSTYPSGYLIPSLFRHPDAPLFQIPEKNWRIWLKQLKPKRYELMAIAALSALSCVFPLQQWLLDQRVAVQARLYDGLVGRSIDQPPPVLLVKIDEASIAAAMQESNSSEALPIPQAYLAKVIRQLAALNPPVIGVDYLVDRPQAATPELASVVQNATQQGTEFIFIMTEDNEGEWVKTLPEIANPQTSLQTDAILAQGVGYAIPQFWHPEQPVPFAYGLAWLHDHCVERSADFCQNLTTSELERRVKRNVDTIMPRVNRHLLTAIAHMLNQRWLHPITDFSIPPEQVYASISAQDLLQNPSDPRLRHIAQQTVIIAPAYPEATAENKEGENSELFSPPPAMQYWYRQSNAYVYKEMATGEHHAYLVNHFLHQRWVSPIPDLWMIGIAGLVGKLAADWSKRQASQSQLMSESNLTQSPTMPQSGAIAFVGGTVLYVAISLGLYASAAAILLPIVFPVTAFWIFVFPTLSPKKQ